MSAVASAVGSGLIGGIGSMIAGNTQAQAAQKAAQQANQTLDKTYNQVRSDESPYTGAGSSAIGTVSSDLQNGTGFAQPFTMSQFYNDPGYQFTLQQGENAVNNSAAAKGGLLSGATQKALAQYSTGLANQTYSDAYNRYLQTSNQDYNQLMGVANLGQNATQSVNQAGLNTGDQQAQNTYNSDIGAGNARAAGIMGATNALAGGATSLGQYYAMSK